MTFNNALASLLLSMDDECEKCDGVFQHSIISWYLDSKYFNIETSLLSRIYMFQGINLCCLWYHTRWFVDTTSLTVQFQGRLHNLHCALFNMRVR